MFSVGNRVQVVDEQRARATAADVRKGEKGTVTALASWSNDYVYVKMDNDHTLEEFTWNIPIEGLRRIHCKKATV